jgi:hypothetical protein
MKTNFSFMLILFMLFGCKNSFSGHEQPAVISKTFVAKSNEPLTLFSKNLRERFSERDGYKIKFTGDHGYKGRYVEFSREDKVILEAMKVPIEGSDYTISIYATDSLSHVDENDLYQIISSDLVEIERPLKKEKTGSGSLPDR